MDKSELMKRYEAETGEILDIDHLSADANGSWYGYIEEIEAELRGLNMLNKWSKEELIQYQAKATAYDRLMSGGKKTLKEWANIFGMPVAVDKNGEVTCFAHAPVMHLDRGDGIWTNGPEYYGEETYLLPPRLIDFDGDWTDSLTLHDGWEANNEHQ